MPFFSGFFGRLLGGFEVTAPSGSKLIFSGLFGGRGRGGDEPDAIFGGFGRDRLKGGDGGDKIFGGWGNDILKGGSGDDHLKGGRGADKFVFDPSNPNEGDDVIKDLDPTKDKIVLNAADIFRAGPNVVGASGDESALDLSDLDPSSDWRLTESDSGDVVVVHPGGTIEIKGLAFSEGLTFGALLGALQVKGLVDGDSGDDHLRGRWKDDLVQGRDGNDKLEGRGGDDVLLGGNGDDSLYGGSGEDDLIGGSGNDHLTGGGDADEFRFDPSNGEEGVDVIKDFEVTIDRIVLNAADVYRADPDIVGANGALDPALDFDADVDWTLSGIGIDDDLLITHPGGTIQVEGVEFGAATDSFVELVLLGALGLEGFVDGSDGVDDNLPGSNIDDLVQGRGGNDTLFGGNGEDILVGGAGEDILFGGSDDDLLQGGTEGDQFWFDPSNEFEGVDVIDDFDPTVDTINLRLSDILDADPDVEDANGAAGFQAADLDFDADWNISEVGGGDTDILVTHPGGTIELSGVNFVPGTTFDALATAGVVVVDPS